MQLQRARTFPVLLMSWAKILSQCLSLNSDEIISGRTGPRRKAPCLRNVVPVLPVAGRKVEIAPSHSSGPLPASLSPERSLSAVW